MQEVGAEAVQDLVAQEQGQEEQQMEEGPLARTPAAPKLPDQAAQEEHRLTHLPFASWCAECVRGRGRETGHARAEVAATRGPTVVQCDFTFVRALAGEPLLTVLTAADDKYFHVFAALVPSKGSAFGARCLKQHLRGLGLERGVLQYDQEPALAQLARRATEGLPGWTVRAAHRASKGSNGRAEQAHQIVQGLARTFLHALAAATGAQLPAQHPGAAWALRHAAWVHARFAVTGDDRSTAFSRQHGRHYDGIVLMWGETVLWKEPGPHKLKLRSAWGYGVWLGRTTLAHSHLCGTRAGVLTARSVRRLPAESRFDRDLLVAMRGHP